MDKRNSEKKGKGSIQSEPYKCIQIEQDQKGALITCASGALISIAYFTYLDPLIECLCFFHMWIFTLYAQL